jgi:hypothetical protein
MAYTGPSFGEGAPKKAPKVKKERSEQAPSADRSKYYGSARCICGPGCRHHLKTTWTYQQGQPIMDLVEDARPECGETFRRGGSPSGFCGVCQPRFPEVDWAAIPGRKDVAHRTELFARAVVDEEAH